MPEYVFAMGLAKVLSLTRAELITRGFFGFVVNTMFRDILAFTIPILLCKFTDPLNFVVYCVGVNFIVTIDDMKVEHVVRGDSLQVYAYFVSYNVEGRVSKCITHPTLHSPIGRYVRGTVHVPPDTLRTWKWSPTADRYLFIRAP